MNKSVLLTLFILVLNFEKIHAIENQFAGARAIGLSDSYISFYDSWGSFHNQAGLSKINGISAGMFFESRFMVDELSYVAGNVVMPTSSGVFALSFTQFGKGTFKENKFGFAYAKQLSENLSAGVQIDYLMTLMPENRIFKGFPTVEGGIIYQPVTGLLVGAHIFNPIGGGVETLNGKDKSPTTVRVGGNYSVSEYVLVTAEVEKSTDLNPIYKTGIEFLPAEDLAIRFGFSGKPFAYTAGIGYKFGKIATDIGFHYHGNLGLTPAISLRFQL